MSLSPCPLCERNDAKIFLPAFYGFEGRVFDLVRCPGCGLIRVEPLPGDDLLARMYQDAYFQKDWNLGVEKGSYEEVVARRLGGEYGKVFSLLERFSPRPKGTLLEIGAAGGGFLHEARERGWEVEGLEFSSWGVEYAKAHYGITLRRGDLIHASLPDQAYDAVFMGDVFEHLTDPRRALQRVHRVLKEEGLLVLLVPTYLASGTFQLIRFSAPLLRAIGVPRDFLAMIKMEPPTSGHAPPYHVFEYSPRTLARMLEKSGFHVELVRGTLPVPDLLREAAPRESAGEALRRSGTRAAYRTIQWSTENLNCPLVRSLVAARKTGPGAERSGKRAFVHSGRTS
jgi:SAM-dependent methyltransferase